MIKQWNSIRAFLLGKTRISQTCVDYPVKTMHLVSWFQEYSWQKRRRHRCWRPNRPPQTVLTFKRCSDSSTWRHSRRSGCWCGRFLGRARSGGSSSLLSPVSWLLRACSGCAEAAGVVDTTASSSPRPRSRRSGLLAARQ